MRYKRLQPIINNHFFVFGPRGTGKSTWLKDAFIDTFIIDLLHGPTYRSLLAAPERIEGMIKPRSEKTIVIDEIQRVPALLNVLHQLIESEDEHRFVLTGSSVRKLRKEGVNLLGGRAFRIDFHPFIARELKSEFDLEKALMWGMLPLVWMSEDPEKQVLAYINLYLEEEVSKEGYTRNLEAFSRCLEVLAFSQGNELNISNIAREVEVGRKLIESYIQILQDMLLCYKIPVFTKRAKRAMTKHSKFYFFDAGVYRSLRSQSMLDSSDEISGVATETLVMQHLKALKSINGDGELYFWRTRGGSEVDFIFLGKEKFWAIEVKHSKVINSKDLRGLKTFREDYPTAELFFIYRGDVEETIDDIKCIPLEGFLKKLH